MWMDGRRAAVPLSVPYVSGKDVSTVDLCKQETDPDEAETSNFTVVA